MSVEDVKRASRQLRGTLAEDLDSGDDSFAADNQSLLKFHGIYQQDDRDVRRQRAAQKLPLAYQCMVRTSVPGGVVSAEQWLAMDDLASELGDGTLRITTRQGIQYHFVSKHDLRALVAALNAKLITTKGACGDVVRNVTACPAPHAGTHQHDLLDTARALAARFRPRTGAYYELWIDGEKAVSAEEPPLDEEPLYGEVYLPRKFKIGLAQPGDNCIDVYTQDVGIVPHDGGYVVLAGGGLGLSHAREEDTYPRLASPIAWVTADELAEVVEAIVTIQRDHGNRQDRHRARLKYTIDDRGIEWFRAELEARIGHALVDPPAALPWVDSDEHLGWHQQDDGRWFLGVHVDNGRVRDTPTVQQRSALRAIVERLGVEVRLTPRQDVLLCGVETADKTEVELILRTHGVALADEMLPLQRLAMACPALPTCGQALGEAERAMPTIIDGVRAELDERGLRALPMRVNVTGCPNGCARPYTAEIGIVGRSKSTYDVYVGGSIAGDRLAERVAVDVPTASLPAALAPLLDRYVRERDEGEGFGDFCFRVGALSLAEAIPVLSRRRRSAETGE